MNSKIISSIILILVLVAPTLALPSVYESTSVSRIVGDTPLEMQNQLGRDDLDLESAGLFDNSFSPLIQSNMLNSFPQEYQQSPDESWLENSGKTLLVYNSQWNDNTHTSNNFIDMDSLPELSSPESLIVANTHYAGISLPKIDAFGDRLSSESSLIAPLSRSSTRFLESVICNLGRNDGLPIGETFRLARNNYHWNTEDKEDIIGLSLLSYALYGNPFAIAEVRKFDTSARDYHCENRLADYTVGMLTSGQIAATADGYQQTHTYTIQDHEIEQIDTYELINSADFELRYEQGELVLPHKSLIFKFPHNTIITGYDIEFSNPAEITANMPEWTGENYTTRACTISSQSESATIDQVNSPDAQIVIAKLNPIAITDCEQGSFTLYQTATITLNYYPYSPIRITSVEAPQESLPTELKTIKVNIENTQNTPTTGTLVLKDEQVIVSVNSISTTQSQHNLEIYTPAEEGTYTYTVEFVQDNNVKTSTTFTTEVSILDASLEIPDVVQDEADINVHITNKKTTSMQSDITAYLSKDGQTISQQTQSTQLQSGESTATFTFTDLQKDDQQYDVLVTIPYENKIKTLTGKIVTNHDPSILNTNVIYNEGETVFITPNVTDADGDTIIASIIDQPFELDGGHTLDYESSGEYTYTVEATDGTTTVQQTFGILVQNTNRPPVLTAPENVTGQEASQLTIQATAIDPDNENSVDNDDNQLTITYDYPFDQNGLYTPTYDDSGEIYVTVTASDGYLSNAKIVKVTIANVNRPPHLDDLTDITIKEGEWVYGQVGRDPDNENSVTNDDNNLTHRYFNVPLDHEGKWKTTYDNSGTYTIGAEVSDGELGVRKDVKLIIENVNRPPVITAPDIIEANGSVDLSVYVTDPDNTNYATNDDNVLTVTYGGSPFDANGVWSPTIPDSTAYTTITVSDGEFTVSKNIYVHVAEVNVQSQQTSPVPVQETEPAAPEPAQSEDPPINEEEEEPEIEEVFSTEPTTEEITTPETDVITEQTQAQPATPVQTGTWGAPQTSTQETIQPPEELEVEVKVRSKQVDDGDSVKVKPDSEFKVKVDVKNNAEEEKDIDVEASIDDLDQEEEDSTTLDPGDSEDFTYEFDIPRITDDDEYDLDIFVKDEKQTKKWNILLKIDKPTHELIITQFSLTPVNCGQISSQAAIQIANTGKNDEEGTIHIGEQDMPFELAEGEERQYTQTLTSLEPGVHSITMMVDYGKQTVQQTEQLTVEACKQEETAIVNAEPEKTQVVIQSGQKAALPVSSELEGIPSKDIISIAFVILSGLFAVTLIIFAIRLGRQC